VAESGAAMTRRRARKALPSIVTAIRASILGETSMMSNRSAFKPVRGGCFHWSGKTV
jgi:hypothetical protein